MYSLCHNLSVLWCSVEVATQTVQNERVPIKLDLLSKAGGRLDWAHVLQFADSCFRQASRRSGFSSSDRISVLPYILLSFTDICEFTVLKRIFR